MKKGLNSFTLKMIAVITMVTDHVGAFLFPQFLVLRIVGRLAFPIFAFLSVEGFFHTRDVKKYLLRLFAFALVSEVPFDLVANGRILEAGHQNIFFTLFTGVLLMYVYSLQYSAAARAGAVILIVLAGDIFRMDYGSWGVLMIFCFFLFRERQMAKNISVAAINVIAFGYIQAFGALALVPIHFYNGERGPKLKYMFYAVYPVHLLLLFLLRMIL